MNDPERRVSASSLAEVLANCGVDGAGLDATGRGGITGEDPELRFDVEQTIALYAQTLARLHAVPVGEVSVLPLLTTDAMVERISVAAAEGIRADGLGPAYRHMTPNRLVEILLERNPGPGTTGAVLSHGRPTLGRFRAEAGRALGFVEWDGLCLADRHLDLAVATRSVATTLGPMLVPLFVEQYLDTPTASMLGVARVVVEGGSVGSSGSDGWRVDPIRLDWWALADELAAASRR